jgi:putative flavoprotein involved in K+ transport
LAGLPFPAPAHSFPTKDQVADYLEAYTTQFQLPVRTGVRVDRLWRDDGRFVVAAGDRSWEADNVAVAMSSFQVPRVPPFAADLNPKIIQLHSAGYRNPSQLQQGGVLVVGAGNSGAEIALEVASRHPTWLAGKESGHVPFRIEGAAARYVFQPLLFRVVGHRVLTVDTPIGRKLRPRLISHGAPLVRVKPKDLAAAGIQRFPRVIGVRDGHPLLADQRVLEVANVIWCTGSGPDFSWIDLPVFGENRNEPMHHRGVVANQPGLYFVGLSFLYAMSSGFLPGVDRDAEHIVRAILGRTGRTSDRPGPAADNGLHRPMRSG